MLLNTRGLSELALIAIGRTIGVFDTTMFTVLVCTAIATTLISGPILGLVYPRSMIEADIEATERSRLAAASAYRVLVVVDDVDTARPAVEVAVDLARSESGAEVVLSHIAASSSRSELGSGFMGELGAMTDSLEHVRALSSELRAHGVASVPQSVFAHDIGTELVAQIRRLRPHLVVIRGGDPPATEHLVSRIVAEGDVDVAVVELDTAMSDRSAEAGAPERAEVVRVGEGDPPHLALAIEIAVRLARGGDRRIERDERRQTSLSELCDQLSIDRAPTASAATVSDLTAVEPGGRPAGSAARHIATYAHESSAGPRQLGRLHDRLDPPAGRSTTTDLEVGPSGG